MGKNHLFFIEIENYLNLQTTIMGNDRWIHQLSKNRSRQGLYEFLNKAYSKIQPGEKVLTVGAGGRVNELLYEYADQNNFEVLSFDINKDKSPDILGDLCEYDFEENSFDTVVVSEVLEHLHAPHLGVDNVYKALKPGGLLIVTTPFIFPIHDKPYDYFRFTKYGLKHLLSNFENVQVKEKNSSLEAIDVLWMRLNKVKGKRTFILKRLIIFTVYYLKRPLTLFLMKYIDTDIMTTGYTVTARKPL